MDSIYTTTPKDLGLIKTLQFPLDIGSSLNGTTNYIVIYINELENSLWSSTKNRPLSKEQRETEAPAIQRSNTATNPALINAKEKVSETVKENTGSNILDQVFPSYVRTANIISLPLPEQLNTTYTTNWNQASMTSMGTEIATIVNSNGGLSGMKNTIIERLKIGSATNAAKMAIGDDAATALTKSVRNQRREFLFDSILPRGFNFTWTLFPRSEEESKAIWDIVQMLKLHSLPELTIGEGTDAGFWVNFPSTFEFEFYTNNQRNDWLFKSSTCALTALDINFTPTGTATFFKSSNKETIPGGNAPNGISISMNFMEMELLYKNRIDMDPNDNTKSGNYNFNTKIKGSLGGVL